MSLPSSSDVRPAATAAAAPPDDPPVVRVVSHGLLVTPKIGIVGLPVAGQHGRIGLAEDHRAGVAQAAHRLGVALGYVVPRLEAACGAHADGLVGVLDRHRDAVQRAADVATCERRVRRVGRAPGRVDVERDDGVQAAVQPFDPRQVVVEQLAARHLAAAERIGQCVGGAESDVRHAESPRVRWRCR